MALRKIERPDWHAFCEGITKVLIGKQAEIEADALSLGAQIGAEWLPLLGIVYDHKDNIFEVALGGGVDHLVHKPRELYVDDGPGGMVSLAIVDEDGIQQIIRLRDPLALPPPTPASR
jgi:hypothetical protein